jgi:hypothetical protein
MDFNNLVTIVFLVLLILLLIIYGVFFTKISSKPYPESQDICPKRWSMDGSGNCVNPIDSSVNSLVENGSWANTTNTPGYSVSRIFGRGSFNPYDLGWASFNGAKSDICGKRNWANTNKIEWNGVKEYNSC